MSNLDHNSNVGTSEDRLSQRRRALIKGSAIAIPAILTLRSGSALAVASSTCVEKYSNAAPLGVTSNNSDVWLREQTECRTLTRSGFPDVQVYRDPTTPLVDNTSTKWYSIDKDNSNVNSAYVWVSAGMMKSGNGGGDEYSYGATTPCYVIVHVNAGGDKTAVYGVSSSEFLIASDSCYCSLHPEILMCDK